MLHIYGLGFDFVFCVPAWLGAGQHWKLESDERKELAKAFEDYLNSLPAKKRAKWLKWLEDNAALATLLYTVGSVAGPRAIKTAQGMKGAKRDGRAGATSGGTSPRVVSGNFSGAGDTEGRGASDGEEEDWETRAIDELREGGFH